MDDVDSAMELYAAKLMVLHAAYKIEHKMEFKQEVSMAKHHVANTLAWSTERCKFTEPSGIRPIRHSRE